MTVHDEQSVSVLVDTQNMYHTAQSIYSTNLDYSAVLDVAVQNRRLKRAIAYVVRADAPQEQDFFDALNDIGFETKIKDIKEYPDGSKKADWDMGIAIDAITFAPHVDAMVLCTGDGDFARLVHHVREKGVRVEVMGFGNSTASELVDAADYFIDMSDDPDGFLL
ncbi:MAG: NYN domain-containing protein [Halobacteria archaeon]|nr:NYN domain-containing protein [Halobacteria archaeon]